MNSESLKDYQFIKINEEENASKSQEKIKILEEDATKSQENQKVLELDRKNKLRKIKNNIQNDKALSDCIKEIKSKEKNLLECKIKKKINAEQLNKILDAKTFCKIYYKTDYLELIDDIKKKHYINFDKYISENKEKQNLILVVDFVFMLSLKEIMKKYFQEQNLIITQANDFFILKFNKAKDQNNIKFVMCLDIPGYKILDLNNIPNMHNFITYYYEVKEKLELNKINNIKNFLIYDPLNDRNNFYLDIQKTNLKNNENSVILLVIDPVYETEDLKLDFYENMYNYIILLYKFNFFELDEKFLEKLFKYFFPNENFDYIPIKASDIKNIKETSSKVLYKLENKKIFFIKNKHKNLIETKFKVNNNHSDLNLIINTGSIIDKNIHCIIESIRFKKNIKINILIEQSCNILYKYLKSMYKNAKFVLLNNNEIMDNKIKDLKEYISTYEKNEEFTTILSYITKYDNEKFDLIILETELNTTNLFDNKEIFIKIKNHLNEKGLFIIHLIADNIYSKNDIFKKLISAFKHVKILNENKLYELNNILICSNN